MQPRTKLRIEQVDADSVVADSRERWRRYLYLDEETRRAPRLNVLIMLR